MKSEFGHNENEIDLTLSREDEIFPSSGFAVSVMDAVRREAVAPPPISFPWKRAVPGLLAAACALILILIAGVVASTRLATTPITPQFSTSMPSAMQSILHGGIESAIVWTGLALLVAFVSVKLSTRVT
jgi:Protein of unknown function (DUF4013)